MKNKCSDFPYSLPAKGNEKETVLLHSVKVVAVAEALMTYKDKSGSYTGYFVNNIKYLAAALNVKENDVINYVKYLCAVHDIGKISPYFASNFPDARDALEKMGINQMALLADDSGYRHEMRSAIVLLREKPSDTLGPEIVSCHHQGHERRVLNWPTEKGKDKSSVTWLKWEKEFYSLMNKCFPAKPITPSLGTNASVASTAMVGMLMLADWVASNESLFNPSDTIVPTPEGIRAYMSQFRPRCEAFLRKNFLITRNFIRKDFLEVHKVKQATPLQTMVQGISLKDVFITIIEDKCGAGKTNAAEELAVRFGVNGIGFFEPTGVTSWAMHKRMTTFLKNLDSSAQPPAWLSSMAKIEDVATISKDYIQATSALKMYYPCCAATIDQLLQCGRKVKYYPLALCGLVGKALILDELHSYDAYMMEVLSPIIDFCKVMHVPIIIASATLSRNAKRALLRDVISLDELDATYPSVNVTPTLPMEAQEDLEEYPQVTTVKYPGLSAKRLVTRVAVDDNIGYRTLEERKKSLIKVNFLPILLYANQIATTAFDTVKNGGNLCVIVNTVDEARSIYKNIEALRVKAQEDFPVFLYHARNTPENRAAVESEILKRYCFEATKPDENGVIQRPKRSIVVATQIVEQSLDIDFDYMMTAIAPIENIIQRLGRYRRFNISRPYLKNEKKGKPSARSISVIIPSDDIFVKSRELIERALGGTAKIYPASAVVETLRVLKTISVPNRKGGAGLDIPIENRYLLESVYSKNLADIKISNGELIDAAAMGTVHFGDTFDLPTYVAELNAGNSNTRQIDDSRSVLILPNRDNSKSISYPDCSYEGIVKMIETNSVHSLPLSAKQSIQKKHSVSSVPVYHLPHVIGASKDKLTETPEIKLFGIVYKVYSENSCDSAILTPEWGLDRRKDA